MTKRVSRPFSPTHLSCLLAFSAGATADFRGCALGLLAGRDGEGLVMREGCWPVVEAGFLGGFLGILLQGGIEMWGREKNAHSGMNCGFWGQGQTEPPSALLEATKELVQREETACQHCLVWSPVAWTAVSFFGILGINSVIPSRLAPFLSLYISASLRRLGVGVSQEG